jgi:isocitrate dehydrogenase
MDAAAKTKVTALPGDGIGPEVMAATMRILEAAGAPIEWEMAAAGAEVFKTGLMTGVPRETLDSIGRNGLALKSPLETPVGFGGKSANVTLRKYFELYANIRPVRELPGVITPFSGRGIDMVIVRENVEDVYAGIEHMQTTSVAQCLKLMTAPGCERIIRAAFSLARAEERKKVTCATKANIMKLTEGMMKRVFEKVGPEFPEFKQEHIIIDNCAHQLVIAPEQFDVIVTSNMNGDIISDEAAGLVGGLGIAPSSNLGDHVAMFEAVHGEPDRASLRRHHDAAAYFGVRGGRDRRAGSIHHPGGRQEPDRGPFAARAWRGDGCVYRPGDCQSGPHLQPPVTDLPKN